MALFPVLYGDNWGPSDFARRFFNDDFGRTFLDGELFDPPFFHQRFYLEPSRLGRAAAELRNHTGDAVACTGDKFAINHEEKSDDRGCYVKREFTRRYVLPEDVDPQSVQCQLTPTGYLALEAPRKNPAPKVDKSKPIPYRGSSRVQRQRRQCCTATTGVPPTSPGGSSTTTSDAPSSTVSCSTLRSSTSGFTWNPAGSGRAAAELQNRTGDAVACTGDKFAINVDTRHFSPEEITVKTKDNSVIIHGKHEEKSDDRGCYVKREFTRRYVLPEDVDPQSVQCQLTPTGYLALEAPRKNPAPKVDKSKPIPIEVRHESSASGDKK
ncbi:hypothetical protein MRX96_029495 [Rhipicephalus microplus]